MDNNNNNKSRYWFTYYLLILTILFGYTDKQLCDINKTLAKINESFNDNNDLDGIRFYFSSSKEISIDRSYSYSQNRMLIGLKINDTTKNIDYQEVYNTVGELNYVAINISNFSKHSKIKDFLRNIDLYDAKISLKFSKNTSQDVIQQYIDLVSGLDNVSIFEIFVYKMDSLNFSKIKAKKLNIIDNISSKKDLGYSINLNEKVQILELHSKCDKHDTNSQYKFDYLNVNSSNGHLCIYYHIYKDCPKSALNDDFICLADDRSFIKIPTNVSITISGLNISSLTENNYLLYGLSNASYAEIRNRLDEYYEFYFNKEENSFEESIKEYFMDDEEHKTLGYF